MVYLLVNHVPFGVGDSPGTYRAGDLFLQDLRAQSRAVQAVGGTLVVASPLLERLSAEVSASFSMSEFRPQDQGFTYVPLPYYNSLKSYLEIRQELRARLRDAIAAADIVQADYGGHPFPLGQVVWRLARGRGRKRIWVFDGGDPFPQWEFAARRDPSAFRRFLKLRNLRSFERFLRREAIPQADLVFAHNNSVATRFSDVWGPQCHRFDRTFVTDELLITPEQLAQRQQLLRQDTSHLRMVVAGRQIAIKGTDHVLKAMAIARKRGAPLRLTVMGDGEDLPRYRALAAELGLNDAIEFAGSVPYGTPLFDAWARHHVLVLTNLTSEFSRNIILSMARGLPLVTYANPGDALVEPNDAGLVVPMGDIDALAGAMLRAHEDREQLSALAGKALELARQRTLDRCHQRRAELAAALVNGKSQPAAEARQTAGIVA